MNQAPQPKIPTPLELKDGMVEDYTANARKAGGDPSVADVERIVLNDIRIHDAVEREKKAAGPQKFKPDEREDTPQILAQKQGMSVIRRGVLDGPEVKHTLLDARPHAVTAKFPAMMARVQRLLAPRVPGVRYRSLKEHLENVADPALGREFMHVFLCYREPNTPVKSNPFLDVASPKDRARMFLRLVEDICDRSTGRHGPWWVK